MIKELAGKTVDVNEEGYMTDLAQWDKSVAEAIAAEEGITLGDRHWAVIDYIQTQFKTDVPLTIRKMGSSGVTDIKEFYALFPGGPLKKATKIAGIPKPKSCI
ncbi:MAG: TusE/DsrC/DsvC family sulfur relay protein [Saprospiraceae bacterium]